MVDRAPVRSLAKKKVKRAPGSVEQEVQKRTAKLRESEEKLKSINSQLQDTADEECKKRLEKEQLLMQQSKMAMMGEMLEAIVHQWRQPLNFLGITIQDICNAYKFGEINQDYLEKFKNDSMSAIKMMSSTIEDFRMFFSPQKVSEQFFVEDAINESLKMLEAQLKDQVKVHFEYVPANKYVVVSYKNELKHVLLNILVNAKDALLEKNKENPFIKIDIIAKDNNLAICIEDSAGGIPEDIIHKIFDSRFTTKKDRNGTGIGLYIAKQITEESLGGKLTVSNTESGAKFVVELAL